MATDPKVEPEPEGSGLHVDVATGDVLTEDLSPEEDKRLLRKLDRCLLPVMALSYLFQYLDKSALASAAVMGLPQDLHLSGDEYSWSSGIYYFGYLIASYPAGVLMVRWKVGKTIALSILVWGAILMLTATCSNVAGLLAARFFLGFAEAAIAPGLTVIVSMWYKRSEQPLRHAAWFLGNTCAGICSGLVNYGIDHIKGIEPWKVSFLILGAVTVSWSVCITFLLPDTPSNARFLNTSDRDKAVVRVKENLTGIKNDEFKWGQCIEALLDVKTWFIFFIQLSSNIPNGGVSTFRSIVIQGLGFSTFDTLLLQCVPYILQLFLVIVSTAGSTYFRNTRTYWMMGNFAIALVGASLVRQLPEHMIWGRYAGTCLSGAYSATFPLLMSLLSGNFGGFTKKTTVNAISFTAYCAGNIIGPQLFFAWEAPSYNSGFLALMICLGVALVLSCAFRFYLVWVNRSRDEDVGSIDDNGTAPQTGIMATLTDKTDKEISEFRYVY